MKRTLTLALLLLAENCGMAVLAQEQSRESSPAADQTEPGPDAAGKMDFYRQRLQDHRLFVADRPDRPCRLIAAPLVRFDNPVSRMGDGMLFLWTDDGRPVAMLKSYYNLKTDTWGRTFVSLASRPLKLTAAGEALWTPKASPVSFQVLHDAPLPAGKPAGRLAQMRAIAREFHVVDHWGISHPADWQLRLLSAPLYRYQQPDKCVLDGAIFGYALSGPEALLLLEVHQTDAGPEWRYAAARCTRFRLTFTRRDTVVAVFPRLDAWPAAEAYFPSAIPMTGYRFGDPFAGNAGSPDNGR